MDLMLCCAFTGHRPAGLPDRGDLSRPDARALYGRLERTVEELYGRGVRDFYCGGAQGFDTWAARVVLSLRRRDPRVKLHLVIPFWGQESAWPPAARAEYDRIRREADESHILAWEYSPGCMQKRNRELVDRAGWLVAYCTQSTGGAAYTLRYAKKKGRRILSLQEEEQLTLDI